MIRPQLLLCFLLFITSVSLAQTDSVFVKADSLKKDSITSVFDSVVKNDINKTAVSINQNIKEIPEDGLRESTQLKEKLFYFLICLLLLLGVLKRSFEKYFYGLFRLFFQPTLKRGLLRDQLLQASAASIILNLFFLVTAGLYISFIIQHFNLAIHSNFWLQFAICSGILGLIYFVKFLWVKIAGQLFGAKKITESYLFLVFGINKLLGIFLLPVLIFLTFGSPFLKTVILYLSWLGIGLLFFYRIILSYSVIRKEISASPFHFLLYVIAFEITPILVGYKLLLNFF